MIALLGSGAVGPLLFGAVAVSPLALRGLRRIRVSEPGCVAWERECSALRERSEKR